MDATRLPETMAGGSARTIPDEPSTGTNAPGDSGPLAPPPLLVNPDDAPPFAPRPQVRQAPKTIPIPQPEWEPQPSVARDRWVTPDDVLETSAHAMYGAVNPYRLRGARRLPRPVRFRPVPKWRSWGTLIVATAVILAALVGALIAGNVGAKLLGPSATATPTVIHQHTATPVAKPKK
ncbi:MAG: hypothetical protein ACRDHE_01770 [Ktedonobacterales bacterium]